MARALILSTLLLGAGLIAGCGSVSSATKMSAPEQRLSNVLTTQHDAEAAYHAGKLKVATTLYLELTTLVPQEADYWYLLGNTYFRMQQPDLAVQAYKQAILRKPDHASAWHNLGIVRMRQAEAAFVSSATTAKRTDPLHDVSSHLADALAAIGKGNADADTEKPLSDTGDVAPQAPSVLPPPAPRQPASKPVPATTLPVANIPATSDVPVTYGASPARATAASKQSAEPATPDSPNSP